MIRIKNLTVSYQRHPAVHHVSGVIKDGGLYAVVGPNGGGKSTFLKALMGLVPVETGHIEYNGLTHKHFAYLPQILDIDRSFPITVMDLILLGHMPCCGLFKKLDNQQIATAQRALHAVELEGFENRPIATLSAGQFQRALFARVMTQDAKIILLDEPFSGIDTRTTMALMKQLLEWHQQGRTVLCVLHDFNLVRDYFPETILIARELVGWGPTTTILTDDNLSHARAMAEAWDDHAALCLPGAA